METTELAKKAASQIREEIKMIISHSKSVPEDGIVKLFGYPRTAIISTWTSMIYKSRTFNSVEDFIDELTSFYNKVGSEF